MIAAMEWDEWERAYPCRTVERIPDHAVDGAEYKSQRSAENVAAKIQESEVYSTGLDVVRFGDAFYVAHDDCAECGTKR